MLLKFLTSVNFNKTIFQSISNLKKYYSQVQNHPSITMRFVQYQYKNENKLGVLSENGETVNELNNVPNNMIDFIKTNVTMDTIKKNLNQTNISVNDIKLISPITNPEKIICIGLNYTGHCLEQNKEPPQEPMFFSKFASTIIGPGESVIAHKITKKLDWEVELAVVIGEEAKGVKKEDAMKYIFGYTIAQDISARDWQKERNGGQFLIGKSMDSFCPLGPSLVHHSLISDPHKLRIKCSINNKLKQNGCTSELIFRIDDIIERLTESITLKPGDVILTGTPGGVGMHRSPPEYLKPGDVIKTEIEELGILVNPVAAP